MNARAERTASWVRSLRSVGLTRPRRRLPAQVPPVTIERDYARAVLAWLEPAREAFAPLLAELPVLIASALRDREVSDSLDISRATVQHIDAGEGRRILELIARARERMASTMSTSSLHDIAMRFARRTAEYQKGQLNRQVRAALGADVFIADRGLEGRVEDFAAENVALITSIPPQLAEKIAQAATRAVTGATPHAQLAKEISGQFGIAKNRAKLIARDQVGKLYGQINAARQRELGVERFVWRTVHDERVRTAHQALDGKTFAYDDPPSEGLPGEPVLCRCWAEPIFGPISSAS